MANNYSFKQSTVTTKKIVGILDVEGNNIMTDTDNYYDISEELLAFNGAQVELLIRRKVESDLTDYED